MGVAIRPDKPFHSRHAQDIIATSLTGTPGQRYLYWRYLEVLGEVVAGENNLVVAPTEGGIPIFFTPNPVERFQPDFAK